MPKAVKLSTTAYGKIFLHVAKYFDCPVLGFVIGTETDEQVDVVDVLTVCHSVPAGPILEIAGNLADHIALPSHKVIGIYYACDRLNNESTPPTFVSNVADGVSALLSRGSSDCCKSMVTLQIKNKLLGSKDRFFIEASVSPVGDCRQQRISNSHANCELYNSKVSDEAKRGGSSSVSVLSANSMLDDMLRQQLPFKLSDCEDHMDCPTKDFRNTFVRTFIDQQQTVQ